ncbi:ArsA family ATPase [Candidatus Gracilibacteria bacterium]|nr:ArsA family ATPase [Candidatus Gracilibacteria bacterium]NJM90161.1 ArsA family ATPase [Hydrococcus sp. RU_2_2]
MALILTFLGKGGIGRTTVAIATAKKFAAQGKRVLLAGQEPIPAMSLLLGTPVSASPTEIAPNLQAVYLSATVMLEQNWTQIKELEAQYLRSPTLKSVYGQELGILPGMDTALALNAIREYDKSGQYDVIIYDGSGDMQTLRMVGIPDILSWYVRRFRKVLSNSDLGGMLAPFIQPIASAIFSVSSSLDELAKDSDNQATSILEAGKAALANPKRVTAYLVTTEDPIAIATAKYLWGSAQQVALTVSGVLLNRSTVTDALTAEFEPLSLSSIPHREGDDWQPLIDALPDFQNVANVPKSVTVDVANRQVQVFLPSFDKKQVKLTQYGPEITIEAGDQRHNLDLPSPLRGQPVQGAKFQNGYLIISF